MSNVLNQIYKIYLTVKGEKILLPQTPEDFTISNQDNTRQETLVNGQPLTIAQRDSAQIFKFDFRITCKEYPFTFKDTLQGIRFYTDLVWQIKEDREPIELTIIRTAGQPSTHVTVLLQDYSYIEDSDELSDYIFSVSFIEYHPQNNQELATTETHHLLVAGGATGWNNEIKGAQKEAVGEAANRIREEAEQSRLDQWGALNG